MTSWMRVCVQSIFNGYNRWKIHQGRWLWVLNKWSSCYLAVSVKYWCTIYWLDSYTYKLTSFIININRIFFTEVKCQLLVLDTWNEHLLYLKTKIKRLFNWLVGLERYSLLICYTMYNETGIHWLKLIPNGYNHPCFQWHSNPWTPVPQISVLPIRPSFV